MTLTPVDMRDWWNREASAAAMTAILSSQHNPTEEDFFASGRAWMDEFAAFANLARVDLRGAAALDFGCGLGRMTRALAARYDQVIGIDVSDEMVSRANRLRISEATKYIHVLETPWPIDDDAVDLAFSTIVVQHIPGPHNARVVDELFRVSRDVVLFDAPSHALGDHAVGAGIFLLHYSEVLRMAIERGFELMALRDFPTTTRQYQYLFRADCRARAP